MYMLTILPIYFFGKLYYDLAKLHKRSAWLYAILGIVIFFAAQFIFGFLLGLFLLVTEVDLNVPDFALSLIGVVFGAAATYGIEHLLKKKWERSPKEALSESDLLDQ